MRRRATARSRPRRRANDRSCGLAEMRAARRGGAFLESRYRAGAVARSSLLLVLVLVLFLVLAVMVVIIVVTGFIVVFGRFQRLVLGGFAFLGLLCLTLARSLVVFIGIEQQVQPRHHLFDRRQLPGRAGFAARAGLALRAGLAARALRTGLARRTRLAARTFRSGPSGMALRSGPTRFAAWALRPLPSLPGDCIVCHGRTPDDSKWIVSRRLMMASIERRGFGGLINKQSPQPIKPQRPIPPHRPIYEAP